VVTALGKSLLGTEAGGYFTTVWSWHSNQPLRPTQPGHPSVVQ